MSILSQTLLDTPTVGLEELQRAAFYVFFEGMNNALAEISDHWQQSDIDFNTATGRNIPSTVLEPIQPGNFHEGHKPSLINNTPDSYPNLAVFGMQAAPSPESPMFDQLSSWLDTILVEVMVKGTDEDETNRRIQRTSEAVVLCLRRNPTLGGALTAEIPDPTIIISDLMALRSPSQSGGYGDKWRWQGAQIQFKPTKDAVKPSSGPGTFSESSGTDYSKYIDQG